MHLKWLSSSALSYVILVSTRSLLPCTPSNRHQKLQSAVSVSWQPDPSTAMSPYRAYVPSSLLTYFLAQSCHHPLLAQR